MTCLRRIAACSCKLYPSIMKGVHSLYETRKAPVGNMIVCKDATVNISWLNDIHIFWHWPWRVTCRNWCFQVDYFQMWLLFFEYRNLPLISPPSYRPIYLKTKNTSGYKLPSSFPCFLNIKHSHRTLRRWTLIHKLLFSYVLVTFVLLQFWFCY